MEYADIAKQAEELSRSAADLAGRAEALSAVSPPLVVGRSIRGRGDGLPFALRHFRACLFRRLLRGLVGDPALHSPLMGVTNAISSVIVVGGLLALGPGDMGFSEVMGFFAVMLASVNIFGGFIVTRRMLRMFKKKKGDPIMNETVTGFAYLAASVLFILSLRGLSSPETARRGNVFGIVGMVVAVVTTLMGPGVSGGSLIWVSLAVLAGGSVGTAIALRIEMTALPQLVAAFHSLVGLAAVFVAMAALYDPVAFGLGSPGFIPGGSLRKWPWARWLARSPSPAPSSPSPSCKGSCPATPSTSRVSTR